MRPECDAEPALVIKFGRFRLFPIRREPLADG
jgi:hypothetical protein